MTSLPPLDHVFWRGVAELLTKHGYDETGLADTLGTALGASGVSVLGAPLYRTAGGRPLDTLIRLFYVGAPVDEPDVADAVAPASVDAWCQQGILERTEAGVRAQITIRPYGETFLAADISRPGELGLRDDYVMGMSQSTMGLARLTVRKPVSKTLDLACGGGYQAMIASTHSERVVATDINPRAIWMAQANLAMNGIERVELRRGDLFEPVGDETFDLIVSNPPFIIGPDISQQFLSTERAGDAVGRELAATAPRHLVEGGYCQYLTNWISVPDEPWWDHISPWFQGSGCDIWVMRLSSDRPDDYAAHWLAAMAHESDEFRARFLAWMEAFDTVGADGIGLGLITMRKRTAEENWLRFNDVTDAFATGSGADIAHLVDLDTWTNQVSATELMETCFVVAPQTRVEQVLRWVGGAFVPESMSMYRDEGFRFSGGIDLGACELLARLHGRYPLRYVLAEITGGDADAFAELLGTVTHLVGRGLVVPLIR